MAQSVSVVGTAEEGGHTQLARYDRRNTAKFWCDSRVPGLSLLHAAFTSHDYARHTHNAFVIAATVAGGAHIKSRDIIESVSPGTLFVSNPEEPQSSWMGDSGCWCYRSIYLALPAMISITQGLGTETLPCFTRSVIRDAPLISSFLDLHSSFEEGLDDVHLDELLIGVLGTLFQRHGSDSVRIAASPHDQTLVNKVTEIMRARCAERLCLSELAGGVGLTIFQLIGLFKRTVGTTPHVILTQSRLNRACHYLRHGHSLAEAALEAGFCDQSAMTKHFKRSYGITPLQFARAVRSS